MTVISSEVRAPRAASAATSWIASPWFFWAALALYLVLHVALRLWETPNIAKNDVQEALAAQGWAWGYHPRNPPLHTWLLMASYSVFGVGLLAHVVLRYLLLGGVYLFGYLSGRRLLSTYALAVVGAISLTLLTPFTWTVHTALTHTLLLAVVILATLWSAMRLTAQRGWGDYILFGVLIGLGFLAKYSYPLFLIPLLAAMLCQTEFRRVLGSPKSLATLGAALAVFAPHGLWMLGARFDFIQFLTDKQHSEAPHPYLIDVASGLGNVAAGALTFLAPLILLAVIFLRKLVRTQPAEISPWARTLGLAAVFGVGLLVLDVFVLRATQFEERYFMCAMLVTPLALFAWVDRRAPELGRNTLARFAGATFVITLIVAAGLTGKALFYNQSCGRCWEEMAVPSLVHQIRTASGFHGGTIIADHYNVAGNMSVAFPDARVIAANYVVEEPRQDAAGQCLLVWNARNAGDALPPTLADYLAQNHLRPPAGEPTYVDAPLLRSAHRMDRFAYWLLPNADGNCEPRGLIAHRGIRTAF
jgi:4-amino-4-deoxy-L-arabinose transferase-like glycosyltransferase